MPKEDAKRPQPEHKRLVEKGYRPQPVAGDPSQPPEGPVQPAQSQTAVQPPATPRPDDG